MDQKTGKLPDCPRCCPFPKGRQRNIVPVGTFKRASRVDPIQRYQCLDCRRTFSDATLTREYRQRKRHINQPLFELLSSAVSMRRAAIVLKISRRTVERRLPYLALVAEDHHKRFLKSLPKADHVQFDDMESWIHTKLKPVSVPLVVTHPKRLILSLDVVSMPAKGKLARAAMAKYGKRPDHRKKGWQSVLAKLPAVTTTGVRVTSDSHKMYPEQIRRYLPNSIHKQVISRRGCVVGQGELKRGGKDPIFSLNHTAAMFRANVNRLARRTWCTSKKAENLKRHMTIYTLWHNENILAKSEGRAKYSPFMGLC